MTRDEEIACKVFSAPRKTAAAAEPAKKRMKYSELLKGSREKRLSSSSGQISKYGSAKNTVIASAAEAERVWSMADAVYANKRRSLLSPLIFE